MSPAYEAGEETVFPCPKHSIIGPRCSMPSNSLPGLSIVCVIIALVLFALGGWSRWWTADPRGPYYPAFLSAALFFWCLSTVVR